MFKAAQAKPLDFWFIYSNSRLISVFSGQFFPCYAERHAEPGKQTELHRTLLYQTKLGTNQSVTTASGMAVAEENWQTKCLAIAQRTTFIFNTELLSDVKFVVPASTGESESTKVIPAHKFVLAISSPVFYAMFYGQMAETKDSIELPECNYQSP